MKNAARFLLALIPFALPAFADTYTLEVNGMHCQHCANRLEGQLQGVEGIKSVDFDLGAKQVKIDVTEGVDLKEEELRKTIEQGGFAVVSFAKSADGASNAQ